MIITGNEDIVKLLNKYDATVNVRNRIYWTPLFYSVLSGKEGVVKALINHEDEDFSLNDMDAQGKTVFHVCAKKGNSKQLNIYINFTDWTIFFYHFSNRLCKYWEDFVFIWCKYKCRG